MALFQRQEKSEVANLYTVGTQKSYMIVGLGNIGQQYAKTRHNIGFAAVDHIAASHDFPGWTEKRTLKAYVNMAQIGQARVVLVKPTTFMNLSGEAIQAVAQFYKITPSETLIIHDELDIPFGQIRTRTGGGSAGNNGIKSIIQHGWQDAHRLRIGIGADTKMDSSAFVLAKFSAEEAKSIPLILRESTSICTEFTTTGHFNAETRKVL